MTWPVALVCMTGILATAWIIESIGFGSNRAYAKGYRNGIEDGSMIKVKQCPKERDKERR